MDFARLLREARDGAPAAWASIHRAYAPLVIGYLRAQSLRDPEDVAGEVFLQLVRDLDRFDGTEPRFRSWLLTIAHHRMLDARRHEARRPAVPMAARDLPSVVAPDDPVAEVEGRDGLGRLLPHLDALTDDQRQVVLLRVLGDLSLEEVARIMERRVGAVKALQHRAFAALRTRLEGPAPAPAARATLGDRIPRPAAGAHPA